MFEKALVSKLINCKDGKYDANPAIPVPKCEGEPIKSITGGS